MRVGIATDHGGFTLKEDLAGRLREAGHEVVDFGARELNQSDVGLGSVAPTAPKGQVLGPAQARSGDEQCPVASPIGEGFFNNR
jgi:hypothetical protein